LPNEHLAAEPPDFIMSESSVSDAMLLAIRHSVWAGFGGESVLPATEIESALAAALDPKLWGEVQHG
jgi:hypothetical protein